MGDQRFTDLERRATELEANVARLTKELAKAHKTLASLQAAQVSPLTPEPAVASPPAP